MIIPRKILERLAFVMLLCMVVLGVYFSRTDLQFYEGSYAREDGIIEWMTVLALFLGFLLSFYRARILTPFRPPRFIVGLYLLSFLFLFGMLEEISYGQRFWEAWFNFDVPLFFKQYNTQGEMNLHNLKFGGTKINKLIFGTLLGIIVVFYFLFLPTLYKKFEKVKNFVDQHALPLPRFYHIVAYLILALLAQMIAGGKKGEILEFGGSWIFLLMCMEPYNRKIFSRTILER